MLLVHAGSFGHNLKADNPDVLRVERLLRQCRSRGFDAVEIAFDPMWSQPVFEKYLKERGIQIRPFYDRFGSSAGFSNHTDLGSFPFAYLIGRDGKVISANFEIAELEPLLKKALG